MTSLSCAQDPSSHAAAACTVYYRRNNIYIYDCGLFVYDFTTAFGRKRYGRVQYRCKSFTIIFVFSERSDSSRMKVNSCCIAVKRHACRTNMCMEAMKSVLIAPKPIIMECKNIPTPEFVTIDPGYRNSKC